MEMNINGQCANCNLMEGGNFLNYETGLREKYGDEAADRLKTEGAKHVIQKASKPDLIEILEHYREAVKEMA